MISASCNVPATFVQKTVTAVRQIISFVIIYALLTQNVFFVSGMKKSALPDSRTRRLSTLQDNRSNISPEKPSKDAKNALGSHASVPPGNMEAAATFTPCNLYPIALHADSLRGVPVGGTISNIYDGSAPGNFGWLTWTGDPSVPALVRSLTPPGDSYT